LDFIGENLSNGEREETGQAMPRRKFAEILVAVSFLGPLASLLSVVGKYFSTEKPKKRASHPRMRIGSVSELPLGKSKMVLYPDNDRPALLIHTEPDTYVAYDAVCTHLGCIAGWMEAEGKMGPSCHGARFSPKDGSVLAGPPPRCLPKIRLEIEPSGDIIANGYEQGLPLFGRENE